MDTAVIVALITGGLAALSNVLVAMMNSKLMIYRIEQLEKKQDKHNSMIERMYIVEGKITAIESDVSELKGKVL